MPTPQSFTGLTGDHVGHADKHVLIALILPLLEKVLTTFRLSKGD